MANTIRLKRASGSDPGASDLVTGEIAVRTDTGKLFTKKDDNSVTEIGVTAIADGSITSAKIADGAIVNADVNASAAIAGTKISPDFGSQAIATTGNISGAQGSFTGDVDIASSLVHTGDTDTKISFATNTIKFDTDSSERLRINSSGNVGIGTTSPSYPLDINAASGDANMRLRTAGTGSGDDTVFRMQVAGTTQDNFIMFGDSDDSNAGQIRYNHSSNFLGITVNASEHLRINSSGDVGIGTTSPSTKLDVNGTVTATAFAGALTGNVTGNASGSSGSCTGNSATATALETARTIAGVSFDGSANISLNNNAITNGAGYITNSLSGSDFTVTNGTNQQVVLGAGDGSIEITRSAGGAFIDFKNSTSEDHDARIQESSGGFTMTGTLTSTFSGNLTGNVTGNVSGSSGSCTGNAATATKLATARTIAGVSFDGSANISLNNNAITNGAGYITSADGGNAATLDSIDSSQFLRSDADDTASGIISVSAGLSFGADARCNAAISSLSDSSTITVDFNSGIHHSVTLGGNRSFGSTNTSVCVGQSGSIFITQDGTGSRTASFNGHYKFVGGTAPTLSTAANAVDRIDYVVKASNVIHCAVSLDVK